MPDYRRGAHTIYDIKYHIVWVTKYRYKILPLGVRSCNATMRYHLRASALFTARLTVL